MAAASNARPVPAPVIALGNTSDDNPTMNPAAEMDITTTASGTRVRSYSAGARAKKCTPMMKATHGAMYVASPIAAKATTPTPMTA